jgi:hypothetical protein
MFILVREDKSIFQSYVCKTQFSYRKVAERHAAEHARNYGSKLTVMSKEEYKAAGYHDLTRKVINLMSGKEVEENINTPYSCSVSSESYWAN